MPCSILFSATAMQIWILPLSVNQKRSGKTTLLLGLTVMAVFQLPLNKWEKTLKIKDQVEYFMVTLLNGTGLSLPESCTESDLSWKAEMCGMLVCRCAGTAVLLRQGWGSAALKIWNPDLGKDKHHKKTGKALLLLRTWPCFRATARKYSDILHFPP